MGMGNSSGPSPSGRGLELRAWSRKGKGGEGDLVWGPWHRWLVTNQQINWK